MPGDRQIQRSEHAGCYLGAGQGRLSCWHGPTPMTGGRHRRRPAGVTWATGFSLGPGVAGAERPPAPPARFLPGGATDDQRAGRFLGHLDVPLPAGQEGLDPLAAPPGRAGAGPGPPNPVPRQSGAARRLTRRAGATCRSSWRSRRRAGWRAGWSAAPKCSSRTSRRTSASAAKASSPCEVIVAVSAEGQEGRCDPSWRRRPHQSR